MASQGGFEIKLEAQGLDKVLGNFQRLPREMQAAVKVAVNAGLQDIASEAKLHAAKPYRPYVRTGRYRSSIGAKGGEGINEVKMLGQDIVGRVGTNVVYAPFLEFGTRRGLPGYHTLENAARAKADSVVKRITDAVGALIRKL